MATHKRKNAAQESPQEEIRFDPGGGLDHLRAAPGHRAGFAAEERKPSGSQIRT